jgi:hypothetical protein
MRSIAVVLIASLAGVSAWGAETVYVVSARQAG